MNRTVAWLAAAGLHSGGLAVVGWWGGNAAAPWLIAALVAGQLLESAVAPDRPDTADASAAVIGGLVLAVVLVSLSTPGTGWPPGAGIVGVGFALRAWAIRTLGPQFLDGVAHLPVHPRIRRGPYRWIRHPGALGTLLITGGAAATLSSATGAGLVGMGLAPVLWWRIRAEERQFTPPP